MTAKSTLAIGLLVAMVLLGGCVPSGSEVIITFTGELSASNQAFRMDGNLSAGGGIPDRGVYENVTLELYMRDGKEVLSERLGDLESEGDQLRVNITTSRIPQYVIFDSPDFWKEEMTVVYYVRGNGQYHRHRAASRTELPI